MKYLFECSKTSLQSFMLAQLNRSANCHKDLRKVFRECVEAEALALLAEWLDLHGEEMMALAVAPPAPKESTDENPKPRVTEMPAAAVRESLKPRPPMWVSGRAYNRRKRA